jgi:radical SAM protein with 4Fe4S-binding SPASM domain
VRRNGDYDLVKRNILDALEARRELGTSTHIYLAYVLMDATRPWVEAFRKEWMSAGVDTIRYIPMHGWGGLNHKDNKVLGDTTGLYRSYSVCPAPWIGFHVFYNGDVSPCCVWTGDPLDEHMGNILETPIMKVWNGPAYREFRQTMLKHPEALHRCGKCTVEPYTNLSIDHCERYYPMSRSFVTEFLKEPLLRRISPTRAPRLQGDDTA